MLARMLTQLEAFEEEEDKMRVQAEKKGRMVRKMKDMQKIEVATHIQERMKQATLGGKGVLRRSFMTRG